MLECACKLLVTYTIFHTHLCSRGVNGALVVVGGHRLGPLPLLTRTSPTVIRVLEPISVWPWRIVGDKIESLCRPLNGQPTPGQDWRHGDEMATNESSSSIGTSYDNVTSIISGRLEKYSIGVVRVTRLKAYFYTISLRIINQPIIANNTRLAIKEASKVTQLLWNTMKWTYNVGNRKW